MMVMFYDNDDANDDGDDDVTIMAVPSSHGLAVLLRMLHRLQPCSGISGARLAKTRNRFK